MFSEVARLHINKAVITETENAKKNYGERYNSKHEGYAVLLEEVQEAADDLEQLNKDLAYLWALIKNNHIKNGNGTISEARDYAEMLAGKAVQVAAVCERFMATIK